jgi:hypothetical protein
MNAQLEEPLKRSTLSVSIPVRGLGGGRNQWASELCDFEARAMYYSSQAKVKW